MSVTWERKCGMAERCRPKKKWGPTRPVVEVVVQEEEWAGAAAWVDWTRIKGEFKIRFDFQI
jgi:hypothetical protein